MLESVTLLMNKLNIPITLQQEVNNLDDKTVLSLVDKCKSSFDTLIAQNDTTRLAVCLYYAENVTKPEYIKKGIPLDIFYDTMSDISIWCDNNENKGLKNYNWIKNHLNLELFRLGRLQFQMYKSNNKTLKYNKLPFDKGENLLYVHIPQGEKLIYSDCVNSILASKEFFAKYFNYQYDFYFCESWLLYSENFLFMTPSSNILQFQSLFEIVYNVPDDHQAVERIFGKRQLLKRKYPEDTTLQKQAKRYILAGNKLGVGIGIISKYDI